MISGSANVVTLCVAAAALAGIIVRPWKLPEALWAVLGAGVLVLAGLMRLADATRAVGRGVDVYLFLIGMMLLAELARQEGLFDWLAAFAVRHARGSPRRLFGLIYVVGTLVTVFLSNDATAVVLTPAVYAAARQARARALPVLFICAFVANAASFVLPISNPANLVVYGARMPSLGRWLTQFGLASIAAVGVTYLMLRWTQRAQLAGRIASDIPIPRLSTGGRLAAAGIALTAVVLLLASSLDWRLGLPTFVAGCATAAVILVAGAGSARAIAKGITWSIVPLVAALFVLVEAVEHTGVLKPLIARLPASSLAAPHAVGLATGSAVAFASNVLNNLPLGLLAGSVATSAQLSPSITGAMLIGVDLGPNLSVTGSLATILWLVALRREGQQVSSWQFLRQGCLVMPPALLAALLVFLWSRVA